VVLLTLNPRPIVDLFKRVALTIKLRSQIVIGEISIQRPPSRNQAAPDEDRYQDKEQQVFSYLDGQ
jgi:hypothetical protein